MGTAFLGVDILSGTSWSVRGRRDGITVRESVLFGSSPLVELFSGDETLAVALELHSFECRVTVAKITTWLNSNSYAFEPMCNQPS